MFLLNAFSYETIKKDGLVPEKDLKWLKNINKTMEREKRQRKERMTGSRDDVTTQRSLHNTSSKVSCT